MGKFVTGFPHFFEHKKSRCSYRYIYSKQYTQPDLRYIVYCNYIITSFYRFVKWDLLVYNEKCNYFTFFTVERRYTL